MNTRDEDEVIEGSPEPQTDGPSFLEMSDEEIMAMPAPPLATPVEAPQQQDQGDVKPEGAVAEQPTPVAEEPTPEAAPEAPTEADGDQPEAKVEGEGEKPQEETKADAPAVDYEAEYKRLLAPFRANGREIKVDSVDDAIALMQMGANYNKRMAALKPNMKLLKMLENNGLLSEEKLSFLIDLDKKNPGAITKLVKESGLDPMDLDTEKAGAYSRSSYAVSDKEMDLDTVLDTLSESEHYTKTLDVVGNKWDAKSRAIVAEQPQLIQVLHDHLASGVYDLISNEIERERVFGRLNGLSDIEAYKQVGDAIHARGGFNHLFQKQASSGNGNATPAAQVVAPKPKVDDGKLKEKRLAASPPRAASPAAVDPGFNPLSMSDEEFLKAAAPRFR